MPSFPTSLATNATLLAALDNASTTLAAGINSSATTFTVVSGSAIAANVVVRIGDELILIGSVAGTTASGCTRGYSGTTAAAHFAGDEVRGNVVAAHHNLTSAELQAVEAQLGAGMRFTRNTVRTTAYDWSYAPAVALTAGNSVTLPLPSFPDGITASSVNKHWLQIVDLDDAPPTTIYSEPVLITGVVVGTSITFTPANNHASGRWTIKSGSAGVQEAIYASTSKIYSMPAGTHTFYERVFIPRIVTIEGDGRKATTINLYKADAYGFFSDQWGYTVRNIRFQTTNTQTGGACIALVGTTPQYQGDADLEVTGCEMYGPYHGIYADWPGGFVRVSNTMMRGVRRYGIYGKASVGWAVQYVNNYFDGAPSPGMIWLEGILAGGVISANWFQKALVAHIVVNAATGYAANELVITGNQIDQDTACTACVVVNGNGVEGQSSNCVKITANFIASVNIGVLCQNSWNVTISDNHFRGRGGDAAVVMSGTTNGKFSILKNVISFDGGTAAYGIQLSSTNTKQARVAGNALESDASMTAMIGIATAVTDGLKLIGNEAGKNITKLVNDVATTGAGQVICKGNAANNIVNAVVASASTITLPLVDEDQMIAITGTTTITQMDGVTVRPGCKAIFVMGAAVSWTAGSGANKIGRNFGPTVAGQVVTARLHTDNLWYLS